MLKFLQERQFSVSPGHFMKWTADAIEGTIYASYFRSGVPTKDKYPDWLRRMEFFRGPQRPLEETRQAWYTEDNLENYFNVARDVFFKVGCRRRRDPKRLCRVDRPKLHAYCGAERSRSHPVRSHRVHESHAGPLLHRTNYTSRHKWQHDIPRIVQ